MGDMLVNRTRMPPLVLVPFSVSIWPALTGGDYVGDDKGAAAVRALGIGKEHLHALGGEVFRRHRGQGAVVTTFPAVSQVWPQTEHSYHAVLKPPVQLA